MNIINKLAKITSSVLYIMPDLPKKYVEGISKYIKTYIIQRCIDNKVLDEDAMAVVSNIDPIQWNDKFDIYNMVKVVKDMGREASHGATDLSMIVVSTNVYNDLLKNRGILDASVCIIYRVTIVPSDLVNDNTILCFSSAKYDGLFYDKLVSVIEVGDLKCQRFTFSQ